MSWTIILLNVLLLYVIMGFASLLITDAVDPGKAHADHIWNNVIKNGAAWPWALAQDVKWLWHTRSCKCDSH